MKEVFIQDLENSEYYGNVRLLLNYRRLKSIKRCNNFAVVQQEDVAQHTMFVTMLAMVIGDEYNIWVREYNKNNTNFTTDGLAKPIHMETVLRKALLHDVDESFTSDIPWNIKHANKEAEQMINKIISDKINSIYKDADSLLLRYKNLSEKCKSGVEGAIVGVSDSLELAVYCFEEYSMGNKGIEKLLLKSLDLVEKQSQINGLMEKSNTLAELVYLLYRYQNESIVSDLLYVD